MLRPFDGSGPRFALLLILVTVAGAVALDGVLSTLWSLWSAYGSATSTGSADWLEDSFGCLLAAGYDPSSGDAANISAVLGRSGLVECMGQQPESYWGVLGTLVLLALAGATYWLLPKWRDRRRPLVSVETVDPDGTLRRELETLHARTGVRVQPRWRVDPTRLTAGACVYGRAGQYTVCLHIGLVSLQRQDIEGFRAVVLHELAHIRRRDVDYAYAGTALWRSFVIGAFIPYVLLFGSALTMMLSGLESPLWKGGLKLLFSQNMAGCFLALLVHLARADLLRRREFQADARAKAWGADPSYWRRRDRSMSGVPVLRRFTALLRTHPNWSERERALAQPGHSTRIDAPTMFLSGAAAIFLAAVAEVLPRTAPEITQVLTVSLAASVLCAHLGVRLADNRWSPRGRIRSGAAAGLWFGLGMLVGEYVTGGMDRTDWFLPEPQYLLAFLFIAAVPAVWWSQCLYLAMGLATPLRRATATTVCALTTAVLLWAGLRWWQLGGQRMAMGVDDVLLPDYYREVIPGDWRPYSWDLTALDLGMSFLTPLHRQTPVIVAAVAASLVPLTLMSLQRVPAAVRLGKTLRWGALGGVLSWGVLAATLLVLHARRPDTHHDRQSVLPVISVWWSIVAVMIACGITAVAVTVLSRRHWLLRAVIATQVTQLCAYVGLFLLHSLDGCLGPMNTTVEVCAWEPATGADHTSRVVLLTLPNAVLGSACAALTGAGAVWITRRVRGHRTDLPARPAPSTSPTGVTARLAGGLLVVIGLPAVLLTTVTAPQAPLGIDTRQYLENRPRPEKQSVARTPEEQALMRSFQAFAWLHHGGTEHTEEVRQDLLDLYTALTKQPLPGEQQDWDGLRNTCAALEGSIRASQEYFPIPLSDQQQRWEPTLSTMRQGARDCVAAVGVAGGGPTVKPRSEADLGAACKQIISAAARWRAVLDSVARIAGGSEQRERTR